MIGNIPWHQRSLTLYFKPPSAMVNARVNVEIFLINFDSRPLPFLSVPMNASWRHEGAPTGAGYERRLGLAAGSLK